MSSSPSMATLNKLFTLSEPHLKNKEPKYLYDIKVINVKGKKYI